MGNFLFHHLNGLSGSDVCHVTARGFWKGNQLVESEVPNSWFGSTVTNYNLEPKNDAFQSRNRAFQSRNLLFLPFGAILRFHVKIWEGKMVPIREVYAPFFANKVEDLIATSWWSVSSTCTTTLKWPASPALKFFSCLRWRNTSRPTSTPPEMKFLKQKAIKMHFKYWTYHPINQCCYDNHVEHVYGSFSG